MVHVNPAIQTVTVKVSSWPEPQNLAYLVDTLRAFGVAGAYLAELDAIRPPASAATPKQKPGKPSNQASQNSRLPRELEDP